MGRRLHPHAAALVVAAVEGLDLNNPGAAAASGGKVMDQTHKAQVAVNAWRVAEQGFSALAAVSGVDGDGVAILTAARLADLVPVYAQARHERSDTIDAWLLTRSGIPLRLASIGDFMDRTATFNADRQAAERAEATRREDAVQRSW